MSTQLSINLRKINKIITNKYSLIAIIIILFQQVCVAATTFWLVKATESIATFPKLSIFLIALGITIFMIDVFETLISPLREKWLMKSHEAFINSFAQANYSKPLSRNSEVARDNLVPMFCSEAEGTIAQTVFYLSDFWAVFLSVIFNIASISIFIDDSFVPAYAVSVVLAALTISFFSKRLLNAAIASQNARLSLAKQIMSGWDNISIGNKNNFRVWNNEKNHLLNSSIVHNVKNEWLKSLCSTSASFITKIPVFFAIAYVITKNLNNAAVLAALLATFTRQMQVINYMQVMIKYIIDAPSFVGKWKGLLFTLEDNTVNESDSLSRISWNKITAKCVVSEKTTTIDDFESLLKMSQVKNGRFEINGSNGAGKSTLLLLVKNRLKDSAIYLPAHHDLQFAKEMNEASTGEKTISFLHELAESDYPVLLLDEWDANLDKHNTAKIDDILSSISQNKCVIEVRHRE